MFDLKRSYFNDLRERPVLSTATILEEGMVLVYVDAGDGTMAVAPSAGAGGELVAGFAITDALKIVTKAVVEQLVVPAGGGTVSLKHANLVTGSTFAFDVTTATALTLVPPAPGAGQYSVNLVNGTVTFNAAQAGNTVSLQYRYSPSLEELLATEHERSINNRAQDFFSSVAVGCLEGEIFTSMYDSSQAYAVGAAVFSGASGLATSAAGGTQIGIVSHVPSVSDGLLGIKFDSLT